MEAQVRESWHGCQLTAIARTRLEEFAGQQRQLSGSQSLRLSPTPKFTRLRPSDSPSGNARSATRVQFFVRQSCWVTSTLIVIVFAAQHANNSARQVFFDFAVTRNRLGDTRRRIAIPIVLCSMSYKHATETFNCLNKFDTLHDKIKSSTRRAPGIVPPDSSAWRSFRCSFRSSRLSPCVQ